MNGPFDPDRQQQLDDTRQRLTRLEAETHRLRAQLARLEAAGEDAAAARLEAQIARNTAAQKAEQAGATSPANRTTVTDSDALTLSDSLIADGPDPQAPSFRRQTIERVDPQAAAGSQPELADSPSPLQTAANQSPVEIAALPTDSDGEDSSRRKRSWVASVRDAPAWATSLGVHVVLVIILSFATLVTLQDNQPMLLASSFDGDDEFTDEFMEMDLSPVELEVNELEEMPLEPTEMTDINLSELDAPWDSAAEGLNDLAPGLAANLPSDMASLMVGEAGGQTEGPGKNGNKPTGGKPGSTQFFGAKSKGDRFVFVIDNSGSMKEGRLETTMLELQQAVGAMSADQMFYVIFYSDQAYPMFYPRSVDEMQPATRDNKRKLGDWLATVEMCVGGRLKEAIEMAAELDPHVVYLLSDGSIGSKRTMEFLTKNNGWQFAVHTLGMTVRDAEDANNLLAIASANGGGFKMVGINPLAAQMSRRRPIPYHNKGPGLVWGTKVAARR